MSTSPGPYGDPQTRRLILDATWALVEDGDSEVRLVDVAERAGVSRRAVYLHFGDRAGLLAALVDHMDEVIDVGAVADSLWSATDPADVLAGIVEVYAHLNPRVDAVARMLEGRPKDAAARAAWRSRLETRRRVHRELLQRVSEAGALAAGWSVDGAADMVHAMMLPAVWRELVDEVGWSIEDCRHHFTAVLRRALLEA